MHWLLSPSHFTQACPQAIVVKGGTERSMQNNKTDYINTNFSHLDHAVGLVGEDIDKYKTQIGNKKQTQKTESKKK